MSLSKNKVTGDDIPVKDLLVKERTKKTTNNAFENRKNNTNMNFSPDYNIKYSKILTFILILFIILFIVISIICYNKLLKTVDIINQQESEINYLKSSISDNRLYFENDIKDYEEQLAFYEKYIAICPNNHSKLYHVYNCPDLDLSSFYIYTIDDAKALGYKECSDCYTFYLKHTLKKYFEE